jgi:hypothetical protein
VGSTAAGSGAALNPFGAAAAQDMLFTSEVNLANTRTNAALSMALQQQGEQQGQQAAGDGSSTGPGASGSSSSNSAAGSRPAVRTLQHYMQEAAAQSSSLQPSSSMALAGPRGKRGSKEPRRSVTTGQLLGRRVTRRRPPATSCASAAAPCPPG